MASCLSLMNSISMAGFFSKKQYAAMADKELAMKLSNERCLECSICAIFFNSSFTVSIRAHFHNRILSATPSRNSLYCFSPWLSVVCMPSIKGSRTGFVRHTPVGTEFPFYILQELFLFQRFPVVHISGVNMKLSISPLSLMTRCSLKPKTSPWNISRIPPSL